MTATAGLAAVIAGTEIASRFRDEPLRVLRYPAAICYLLVNAGISLGVLAFAHGFGRRFGVSPEASPGALALTRPWSPGRGGRGLAQLIDDDQGRRPGRRCRTQFGADGAALGTGGTDRPSARQRAAGPDDLDWPVVPTRLRRAGRIDQPLAATARSRRRRRFGRARPAPDSTAVDVSDEAGAHAALVAARRLSTMLGELADSVPDLVALPHAQLVRLRREGADDDQVRCT